MGSRRTDIHVRNGALAASMPLGPLRETCLPPAPKSRLVVFERYVYEDQKQIKGFPAEAGPTVGADSKGGLIVPALCVGMHPVTLRVT